MLTSSAERPRFTIAPGVGAALANFSVPESLGFGNVHAPVMFTAQYANGRWNDGVLEPYGALAILPGARALQYAELVFEGLKAYRIGSERANLFRPAENWRRLTRSAERLAMAVVPEELFFGAIDAVVGACLEFIPRTSGRALYLRPFLFGTEAGYMLRNSTTFGFAVIANPVEAYATGHMRVAIERRDVRAAAGGVGAAKTAANYAASLRGSSAAVARGMNVALWLDGRERRYIQELSGMNVFAVINGELHTPELDGAILPGVTRDSLLQLSRHLGYTVVERPMVLDDLLQQLQTGECSEIFACGTAAIVSPIGILADTGNASDATGVDYVPKQIDGVAGRLREALLAIQERRAPDPFGWTRDVPVF